VEYNNFSEMEREIKCVRVRAYTFAMKSQHKIMWQKKIKVIFVVI